MNASLKHHLPGLAILLLILLLLFLRSFDPRLTLSVGDDSLAIMRNHYRLLPTMFTGSWVATNGLGNGGAPVDAAPGFLFTFLVPFFKYVDANALFHLFVMGLAGYFFIHDCTRNRFAALTGGLFLMLQPHILSHLLPGHVGHFIMAGWIVPSFLFTRRAILQGGLLNWSLAGTCFGFLVAAGQHDVAAFIGISLSAYGLFLLARTAKTRKSIGSWLGVGGGVVWVCILTGLLAYQALFGGLRTQLRSQQKAKVTQQEQAETVNPQEKWFWATQWSVPPIETLDAAVPGFFGWGSSDPQNPYRGRIGQTEGWMKHRQGMPNLNDVCQYVGGIMLLGLLLALGLRRRDPEVWFFAVLGVVTLVLSFGKFGPLYQYFFAIPGVDSLRNPIKWYYVTSLCAGILGALGLAEASRGDSPALPRWKSALLAFLPGLIVVAVAAAALSSLEKSAFPFWQQKALVEASEASVSHALVIWVLAGLSVFLILMGKKSLSRLGMGLAVLVLAGELIFVNSHYMPYHTWENEVRAGPFNDFLDTVKKPYRFRFLRQDGVFHLLKGIVEMEGLENADPYAARIQDTFLRIQRELEPRDPLKFWQLSNVRYVVAPGTLKDPALTPVLSLKAGNTTVTVHEFLNALPRCLWVSSWEVIPEREAAARMARPDFDPARQALVHEPAPGLAAPPTTPDSNATCRIASYAWTRTAVETTSERNGLVVCLSQFDPNIKALVDGKPAPLYKVNGMLQACPVPAGRHQVEFLYQPEGAKRARLISGIAWGLVLASIAAGFLIDRRRNRGTA